MPFGPPTVWLWDIEGRRIGQMTCALRPLGEGLVSVWDRPLATIMHTDGDSSRRLFGFLEQYPTVLATVPGQSALQVSPLEQQSSN